MNRLTFLTIALACLLFSCVKEQVSIEHAELILETENEVLTKLNLYNNEIHYDIMLPSDLDISTAEISINSEADPIGIQIQDELTAGSYTKGSKEYNYLRATGIISAGSFSDADKELIKVKNGLDIISVTVGDNLIIETIEVDSKEVFSINYWPGINIDEVAATVTLHGYHFDGSENPSINVNTSHDLQQVTVQGVWTDPSQYQGTPPFSSYTFSLDFMKYMNTSGTTIGATDDCEVYIEYNGITYISILDNSNNLPLLPVAK